MAERPTQSEDGANAHGTGDERVSVSMLLLQRFDRLEADMRDQRTELLQRIDHLEGRMEQGLDRMDQGLGRMEQRVGRMEQRLDGVLTWAIASVVAVIVGAGAVVVTLVAHKP